MIPLPPDVDGRLQKRYEVLVQAHFGQAQRTATGPRPLPAPTEAFAATQGAWRFWRHDDVTLPKLAHPLLAYLQQAIHRDCQRYVLVVHDWSHLNYVTHRSKKDLRRSSKKGEAGYELSMALAVSDQTGTP